MPIFSLKPIDNEYSGWRYSTYKGEAIVRATCEKDARNLANLHFSIMASVRLGADGATGPWTQKSIVSCETLEEASLQSDGVSEIISPKE